MNSVYLAGFGLASSMGADLKEALQQLQCPPPPQQRSIKGLDYSIPYYAIPHGVEQSALPWNSRCARLINQVIAETGCTDRTGTLYLASASINAGAVEAGEAHATNLPAFLSELSSLLAWQGPVYWINTACTSSLSAILAAYDALMSESIDEAMIVGLEMENNLSLAGFSGMQLLSRQSAQPFGTERNGLVLGEAVAALRLSRQASRWRIAGGAQVIDSSLASGASKVAYQAMLEKALAHAQLSSEQIDLIKVQAAGSIANDAIEAQALCNFFAPMPALLSLKTFIGHTLGASGAAEIALLLAILEQRQWPQQAHPTDPALGVELAAQAPEKPKHILACILGFGGSHSCIALEDTGCSHDK